MSFLVVDAHSKWPEVHVVGVMYNCSHDNWDSLAPKLEMSLSFAVVLSAQQHAAFALLVKQSGIKHIHTSPYHSSLNCADEQLVQAFKQDMKATANNRLTLQHYLGSACPTIGPVPLVLYTRRVSQ